MCLTLNKIKIVFELMITAYKIEQLQVNILLLVSRGKNLIKTYLKSLNFIFSKLKSFNYN